MTTIETEIDISALKESGKRGHELVKWAYEVLRYDGEKLVHTAIYAGTPHVDHIRCASMLGYSVSTVRNWCSQSSGPIQPRYINSKPYWRMCDIRKLLEL